jgi:hypothetical protein
MNIQPSLNKNLPRPHLELKFGVLGVSKITCETCSSLVQKEKLDSLILFYLQDDQTTNKLN